MNVSFVFFIAGILGFTGFFGGFSFSALSYAPGNSLEEVNR